MPPKPPAASTYKNVGVHAQSIDGGQVLDLGETIDLDKEGVNRNQQYIDAGVLADVATLSPSDPSTEQTSTE